MSYLPILKAKKFDIIGVSELQLTSTNNVFPIFEIPTIDDAWLSRIHVSLQRNKPAYLVDCTVKKIVKGLSHRAFSVDISNWPSNAKCLDGRHIIEHLAQNISSQGAGSGSGLCLNYGAWDDVEYQKSITSNRSLVKVVRLEQLAIDDSIEEDLFEEKIDQIIRDVQLDLENCFVLIDFESVFDVDVKKLFRPLDRMVKLLVRAGFKKIGVGGGSMTSEVAKYTEENSAKFLPSQEVELFHRIVDNSNVESPCFSDYGVRPPTFNSDFNNPNANAKLRYTVPGGYMLHRGEAKSKISLKTQHPRLAKIVCESEYFSTIRFSWGDKQLIDCMNNKLKSGVLGLIIAIDTNHHLTYVAQEVAYIVSARAVQIVPESLDV